MSKYDNPLIDLLDSPTPDEIAAEAVTAAREDALIFIAGGTPFDPTKLRDRHGKAAAAKALLALMDEDKCHMDSDGILMVPGAKPTPPSARPAPAASSPAPEPTPPTALPDLTPAQRRSLYFLAIAPRGLHVITSPDARQRGLIDTGYTVMDGHELHYAHPSDTDIPADEIAAVRKATRAVLFHLNAVGATDLTELTDTPEAMRAAACARLGGVLIRRHNGRYSLIERRRPSTDTARAAQAANRRVMMDEKPKPAADDDAPTAQVHDALTVGVSRDEAVAWMNKTYNVLVTMNDAVRASAQTAPVHGAPTVEDVLRRCMRGIAAHGAPCTKTEIAKRRITPSARALVPAALDFGVHVGALRIDGHRARGYGVRYTIHDPSTVGLSWDDLHTAATTPGRTRT